MMRCKEQVAALVECARREEKPDAALAAHLVSCAACEARWESEIALSGQFRAMRAGAMASSSESQPRRDVRFARLMRQMSDRKEPVAIRPRRHPWGWAAAAAAAVLLAIGIGYGFRAQRGEVVYEAGLVDASTAMDDFIALPYALPAVPGEMVSIVHSNFSPETLASLGIEVDPAWQGDGSDDIGADVVVGQDGFPRAVRITNDTTQF